MGLKYRHFLEQTNIASIKSQPPANRDICIYPVADSYKNISPLNQCSDPMVYPLPFRNGQCGWNPNMEHVEERRSAKRVRVTQSEYFSYRFAVRNAFSILHNSGKLFQQYIVDASVKTEGFRLNYLRLNQKDLLVELYERLLDALQTEVANTGSKMGKLIILPSSFQGSPPHMQQNYQDAMVQVMKYGRLGFFRYLYM
ncbi:hypothetical protein AVEN_141284-1 [Araneus ventricosus]|uniref:Helitron helicase-like domain-containing protein n=1 Tax=Araneus ventricosus TaxID=182803 RepID=A0A4Y2LBW1_ARAVE|nr:hypothetical protein AVEN_141284-1 [Araneus ventricosus]